MSFSLIFGNGFQKNQERLIDIAAEWLSRSPEHEVYCLVPNYLKFERELSLLNDLGKRFGGPASFRFQVFSFSRLAWFLLKDTVAYQKEALSEIGNKMMLRKILSTQQDKLHVYARQAGKAGFVTQVEQLLDECAQNDVTAAELSAAAKKEKGELAQKLQDLATLYTSYQEALAAEKMRSGDVLGLLSEKLASLDLSKVLFLALDFDVLNAAEINVFEAIVQANGSLAVSLLLDRAYIDHLPEAYDLYAESGKLFYQLYHLGKSAGRSVTLERLLDQKQQKYQRPASPFANLAEYWQTSLTAAPARLWPPAPLDQHLACWRAGDRYQEVLAAASEIRRLSVEEGVRFEDITLFIRDDATYLELIRQVFPKLGIAYSLTMPERMDRHPLSIWIQTLFDIDTYHFRYADMLQFLKTQLFWPEEALEARDPAAWRAHYLPQIDELENFVLAHGIEGSDWERDSADPHSIWQGFAPELVKKMSEKEQKTLQQIQRFASLVRQTIVPFFRKIKKAQSGREAAETFYRFLLECRVEELLISWRDELIAAGELAQAKRQEQTWQTLLQILDEFVLVFGKEPFDFELFKEALTTGLEETTYLQIPQSIDQVQVLSLDVVRPQQNQYVFALGLNENTLPKKYENRTLLSDEERRRLAAIEVEFAYSSLATMNDEPFLTYRLLISAERQLYLSYAVSVDDAPQKQSPFIARIQEAFHLPLAEKNALLACENDQATLARIASKRQLISDLVLVSRLEREGGRLNALWQEGRRYILADEKWRSFARHVFESEHYSNRPAAITASQVAALYGDRLNVSVSQMENFYLCEYRYFLTYGLHLREREVFGITPLDMGNIFHAGMDGIVKLLLTQTDRLDTLSEAEFSSLIDQALALLFDSAQLRFLDRNARMSYIRRKIREILLQTSNQLYRQSRWTANKPLATEIPFGFTTAADELKGLELTLAADRKLFVRGKIDRIDWLEAASADYFSVVDYKSSRHRFDLTDAFEGLSLQMLTYLQILLENQQHPLLKRSNKPFHAGGAYYLQLQNPFLSEKTNDPERKLLEKFKYDGITVTYPEFLAGLDESDDDRSLIYPIKKAKDGIKITNNSGLAPQELELLLANNRGRFAAAGEEILAGKIQLNPVRRENGESACSHCDFRGVCQFDPWIKGNRYRRIKKLPPEEIFQLLGKRTEGVSQNED